MKLKLSLAFAVGVLGPFLAISGITLILTYKDTIDGIGTKIGEFCFNNPIVSSSVLIGIVIVIVFRQIFKSH